MRPVLPCVYQLPAVPVHTLAFKLPSPLLPAFFQGLCTEGGLGNPGLKFYNRACG